MNIKQVNKKELELSTIDNKKTFKKYIPIDSEEGQALIKEHGIKIDPEMKEF